MLKYVKVYLIMNYVWRVCSKVLLFALFALPFYPVAPVSAIPSDPTTNVLETNKKPNNNSRQKANKPQNNNTNDDPLNPANLNNNDPAKSNQILDENSESKASKASANCAKNIGSLHWLVCSNTDVISNFVDGVYNLIKDLLVVSPITTDANSPIHLIWVKLRDITNYIFVIFLIVVLFSQLSGFGINNYGIKRILPRAIIAAVIINFSFIFCLLAVDISNILGSSINGLFGSIMDDSFKNVGGINISVGEVVTAILGGGTLTIGTTAIAIALTASSWTAILFVLLSVLFGCALSLLIALITLATRQALVYLLVMASPIALVCYMLPNTESWFKKWRSLFFSMLIFFPMFSIMFGACRLAGSTILISATGPLMIILGIAVKILPLFLAFPLLRMSSTLPGKVSSLLHDKLANPAARKFGAWSESKGAAASAERARKAAQYSGKNRLTHMQDYLAQRKYEREAKIASNNEMATSLRSIRLNAKKQGFNITGFDSDGTPSFETTFAQDQDGNRIYDKHGNPVMQKKARFSKEMEQEALKRNIAMRHDNSALEMNNNLGQLGNYLERNNISNPLLANIAASNSEQFLESEALQTAAHRNNIADKRFIAESIKEANEMNPDGSAKNPELYHKHIFTAAGVDAFDTEASVRQAALTSVVASAESALDRERQENIKNYTSFLERQASPHILNFLESSGKNQNDEASVAAIRILDKRGDHDTMQEKIINLFDANGGISIDSDFARSIGENLLPSNDVDLKSFGKHLMVQNGTFVSGQNKIQKLKDEINHTKERINRHDYANPQELSQLQQHITENSTKLQEEEDSLRSSKVTYKEYITGFDDLGHAVKKGGIVGLVQGKKFDKAERTTMPNLISAVKRSYYVDEAAEARGKLSASEIAAAEKLWRDRQDALYQAVLPNFQGAAAAYSSNSEQMNSAMNFVTGIKFDPLKGDKGEWVTDKKAVFTTKQYEQRVGDFFSTLTPEKVINFKSDWIAALTAYFGSRDLDSNFRVTKVYDSVDLNKGKTNLKNYLLNIYGDNPRGDYVKGKGTITKILDGDPSALVSMKSNIRELLDIPDTKKP